MLPSPRFLLSLFLVGGGLRLAAGAPPALMPLPAELAWHEGSLPVPAGVTVALTGADDGRLGPAIDRLLQTWSTRTGTDYRQQPAAPATALLRLGCAAAGSPRAQLGEDESYTLEITPRQIVIRAPTTTGGLRALATLTQLFTSGSAGGLVPAVTIRDRPRFAWRGLMIDASRHWMPPEVIRRELDGMALVKLNVLHLHLCDDQGFRIESRTHSELQQKASDGHFYTQEEMRGLLAYAHARGIRVVPEFDVPGHATAWVTARPELASAPGPYTVARDWGVHNPVLDPTNEALYPFLADFLGEMAALFPDDYLHIGGDENNGVQWSANPRIQEFIRTHGLKDNPGLHTWFNRRLTGLLQKLGKRLIGWDEILHPDLPKDSVIHTWRGPEGVVKAARAGHPVVLSNGYYIDLYHPALAHYEVDPLPADTPLTPAQQALVLGGEATMWAEWVTPDLIDTRIWPRTAAIAERLWSPRTPVDAAGLTRRLPVVEAWLEAAGLNPTHWPRVELPDIDPKSPPAAALLALAAVVEPVKVYQREDLQPQVGQLAPLNELADWAGPESRSARDVNAALEAWLMADGPLAAESARTFTDQFNRWQQTGELAAQVPGGAEPRGRDRVRVARSLRSLSHLGAGAIATLLAGQPASPAWLESARHTLDEAKPGPAAVEFPFLPALRFLVAATENPTLRDHLPRADWRARLVPPAPTSAAHPAGGAIPNNWHPPAIKTPLDTAAASRHPSAAWLPLLLPVPPGR